MPDRGSRFLGLAFVGCAALVNVVLTIGGTALAAQFGSATLATVIAVVGIGLTALCARTWGYLRGG